MRDSKNLKTQQRRLKLIRVNIKSNVATLSELETRHLTLIGKSLYHYANNFKLLRSNSCSIHIHYRLQCFENVQVLGGLIVSL